MTPMDTLPVVLFPEPQDWAAWLEEHHESSPGAWLKLAKKDSGLRSLSYAEALDVALCFGWIDAQKKGLDESAWLQKFTPRTKKSLWSKINRDKVEALMREGRMRPAGLRAVESAKADGRWDAAYDGSRSATVPEDFQAALDRNPSAKAFFATLSSASRYSMLFRLQTAKRAETRARNIERFVAMLEKGEKPYP